MKPERIVIHCSDTPNNMDWVSSKHIDDWHKQKGFKEIGYHFVIKRDGELETGRPMNKMGAHVKGHNYDSIGICLIGKDKFTREQFKSLRYCLEGIYQLYGISEDKIFCHYELDSKKTCPNIRAGCIIAWYILNKDELLDKYLALY